jgi:hypothetical protein
MDNLNSHIYLLYYKIPDRFNDKITMDLISTFPDNDQNYFFDIK